MPFRTIARLNPAKPKAGEEFRLQVVAQHPNEPGTRRDAEGKLIPAKYINLVEVYFEGEKVAEARPGPSTSANQETMCCTIRIAAVSTPAWIIRRRWHSITSASA